MAVKALVLVGLLHIMNVELAAIARSNKLLTNILFDDKALDNSITVPASSNIGDTNLSGSRRHDKVNNQVPKSTTGNISEKPVFIDLTDQYEHDKSKKSKKYNILSNLDDMNQNWGILVNSTSTDYDETIYSRPINIPKPHKEGPLHEIDATDNGRQGRALIANIRKSTVQKPNDNALLFKTENNEKLNEMPTPCEFALILCCTKNTDVGKCFTSRGCFKQTALRQYEDMCMKKEIDETVKKITKYYTQKDI